MHTSCVLEDKSRVQTLTDVLEGFRNPKYGFTILISNVHVPIVLTK
jgi:hypothetical protein